VFIDVLVVLSIPFVAGFLAGFAYRSYLSRRHRRLAQQQSPWQRAGPDRRL
jgi:hypothetical protein